VARELLAQRGISAPVRTDALEPAGIEVAGCGG
jgi:hypothetical protein